MDGHLKASDTAGLWMSRMFNIFRRHVDLHITSLTSTYTQHCNVSLIYCATPELMPSVESGELT